MRGAQRLIFLDGFVEYAVPNEPKQRAYGHRYIVAVYVYSAAAGVLFAGLIKKKKVKSVFIDAHIVTR